MAKKIYSVAIQQKYWLEDEELHFYKVNQHWLFDIQLVDCQGEIRAMSLWVWGEASWQYSRKKTQLYKKTPNPTKNPNVIFQKIQRLNI